MNADMPGFLGWLALICSAIVGGLSPFVVRPLLAARNVVDSPTSRSSHDSPVLRGGGVAPLLAFLVGIGGLAALAGAPSALPLLLIAAAAAAFALIGLLEDLKGVAIQNRLLSQFAAASVYVGAVAWIYGSLPWFALLGIVLAVSYVNVANFMDGLDGMSSLHGLVVGLTYSLAGFIYETDWLFWAGLVLAVSFLLFLPWNVLGARMFLGDVGSYLLGGAVASIGILAAFSGVDPVILLAPCAIYLFDTSLTLSTRLARGERISAAHRSHIYQRLQRAGLSHLSVSSIVASFSAAATGFGVLHVLDVIVLPVALVGVGALAVTYAVLPRWRTASRVNVEDAVSLERVVRARADFKPRTFAVLGASGFVGAEISAHLVAQGFDVVHVRAPRLAVDPTFGSEQIVASINSSSPEVLLMAEDFKDADVVINAAGVADPDGRASESMFGANAMLPAACFLGAKAAGVQRVIHISSAAVQGRRPVLDTTLEYAPFSPYSSSKVLGEMSFLSVSRDVSHIDALIVRATSVQGPGRPTSRSLRAVAGSRLSSVARPGSQPTVVSSITGLAKAVERVATWNGEMSAVQLQPWEGLSVSEVLTFVSGKRPITLPRGLCWAVLYVAHRVGRISPRIAGVGRRLEVMWMGQRQMPAPVFLHHLNDTGELELLLKSTKSTL